MKSHASLNRIYRLVWSHVLNAWVAVAETSRGFGKGGSRKLAKVASAISLATLSVGFAQAEPTGGVVVAGSGTATIASGAGTVITQTTPNVSINWTGFNIGVGETVNFVQPTSASIAVNRIYDTSGTSIMGSLTANGHVYLINPNGILFAPGSHVDVGGLVASTLDMNDASLLTNSRYFSGTGTGSIVNKGNISVPVGGFVALLGNTVINGANLNEGNITAPLGTVALGAGSAVTLTFAGNSLVQMMVNQSLVTTLAENKQLIKADGGVVIMTAGAADALLASVVNNTGIIEAKTVKNHTGVITLLGGMVNGTVNVDGTLDVSVIRSGVAGAPNGGNGGFIQTSGKKVTVAGTAIVKTEGDLGTFGNGGTWLIDPVDFTIAAKDGDITGTDLANLLNTNSVTIRTGLGTNNTVGLGGTALTSLYGSAAANGDINVNDSVSWNAHTLTLIAKNNINFNNNINATGSAKLALEYGQGKTIPTATNINASDFFIKAAINLPTGDNFSTKLGLDGIAKTYTVLNDLGAPSSTNGVDLQGMLPGGNYVLGSNIEASSTSAGLGFNPIGITTPYSGTFNGLGHTINNFHINRNSAYNGLFGVLSEYAVIRDIGITNGNVKGTAQTGGLVGNATSASISNSYFEGVVFGTEGTGGLVGDSTNGNITNSYFKGTGTGYAVQGTAGTGGLVGVKVGGNISNSYALGNVFGTAGTGGLVGSIKTGEVTNSYAKGNVTGTAQTGGLVGTSGGLISNSFAWGNATATPGAINVFGTANVGGLVGSTIGNVENSYATGNVFGGNTLGGLVGYSEGTIKYSYATGNVTGDLAQSGVTKTGGLAGHTKGAVSDSYAIGNVIGVAASGGLIGLADGPINRTYAMGGVQGTQSGGLVGELNASIENSLYNTSANAGGYPYAAQALGFIAPATGIGANGLTAAQMQDINYFTNTKAPGSLNPLAPNWDYDYVWAMYPATATSAASTPLLQTLINKVIITANSQTKEYDNTSYTGGVGFTSTSTPFASAGSNGATGTLGYLTSASSNGAKNVGSYVISPTGLSYLNQQFQLKYIDGLLTITPKQLVVNGLTAVGKVYDGTTAATANLNRALATVTDPGYGDTIALDASSGVGTFSNKDVGTRTISLSAFSLTGSNLSNYTVVQPANFSADITQAPLTVTADNISKTYGNTTSFVGTEFGVNTTVAGVSGLQNSETIGSVSLSSAGAVNTANASITPYSIVASAATGGTFDANNYTIIYSKGNLTVNKANASITANSGTKTYNGLDQSVTGFTATGLVNSETTAVLSGVTISGTGKAAGDYATIASGADANYNLTFTNGNLAIGKASASVTANSGTKTYNGLDQSVTGFTASGLVNNEATTVLSGVSGVGTGKAAGNYATVASGTDSNYNLSFIDGNLAIGKASASVTANSGTKTYNGLDQIVTGFTASGLVNNEAATVLSGISVSGTGKAAGDYATVASGTDTNYNLSFTNGNLAIAKANASVTASSANVTYNGLTQNVSNFTATGLVNGEADSVLSGISILGGGKNVGQYNIVASGTDANYNLTFSNGLLDIAQANASVTANSGVLSYTGVNQSINGFTASGLQNAETVAVLSNVSASGTGITVGNYATVASGTDTNYKLSFIDGNLAIGKASAIVTANSGNVIYNGLAQNLAGFSATGLINGETAADLTGVSATGTGTNAGSYDVIASGSATNYDLSFVKGVFAISKAAATITANSGNRTYNGVSQNITGFSSAGLVNNENAATVLSNVSATGSGTNAGAYEVIASGTAANYDLSFVKGALTIGKATATITANIANVMYNGLFQNGSGFTATGLVNGETSTVLSGVNTAGGGQNVGRYDVLASGSDNNYDLIFNNGSLTIGKAAATVTANSANKTYSGLAQSETGFTSSGLVNNETAATVLSNVSATGTGTNAGNYDVIASGNASNYDLTFVNGALSIGKAAATVTANSNNVTYNGLMQNGNGFTASGLVNGETSAVLSAVSISGGGKNVGSYNLAASGADANYNLTFNDGNLSINKAPLIVTADHQTRLYGAINPTLTTTVTGFVNGETLATSGVTGVGIANTTATASTGVGNVAIVANISGLAANNYDFSAANGNLIINKAHLTVTADNQVQTYGSAIPTLTTSVTGFLMGQDATVVSGAGSASVPVNSVTNVGTPTLITAGAGTLTASNYDFTNLVNGQLTAGKAHLTVTADNTTRLYGQANPYFSVTASGFMNGETALTAAGYVQTSSATSAVTSADNVGTYANAIKVNANTLSATNYDFTNFVDGTLTINKAHITVTADNKLQLVNRPTPLLTSTLSGFVNGENALNAAGFKGESSAMIAAGSILKAGTSAVISAQANTLLADNYDFVTLANGQLFVMDKLPDLESKFTFNLSPTIMLNSVETVTGNNINFDKIGSGIQVAKVNDKSKVKPGSDRTGACSIGDVSNMSKFGCIGPLLNIEGGGIRMPISALNASL